jgi:hypothetical protein
MFDSRNPIPKKGVSGDATQTRLCPMCTSLEQPLELGLEDIGKIAKGENEGFYQFASDRLLPDNPPDILSLKESSDEESSTL